MQRMTESAVPVAAAADAIERMGEVTKPTQVERDNAVTRGYVAIAAHSLILESVSDAATLATATRNGGNANADDVTSDTLERLAEMVGNGLAIEKVTRGLIARTVKRECAKYGKRTEREIPQAIGMVATADDVNDAREPIAPTADESGDIRDESGRLIYRAPRVLRIPTLSTLPNAPVPSDAYGRGWKASEWEKAAMRRFSHHPYDGNVPNVLADMGLFSPIERAAAQGGQKGETESGRPIYRLPVAATIRTLTNRSSRYSMGYNGPTVRDHSGKIVAKGISPAQAVAIEIARSLGAIAPTWTHRPTGGDPTYLLATSEPSAESVYFRQIERMAEVAAAEHTLYGPDAYRVSSFEIPAVAYRRRIRTCDACHRNGTESACKHDNATLRNRGTYSTTPHIRWADMGNAANVDRRTLKDRVRKVVRTFRGKRGSLVRSIHSAGIVPEPRAMVRKRGRMMGKIVRGYVPLTSGSDTMGGHWFDDPDGSLIYSDSLTVENMQANMVRNMERNAAEKAASDAAIEQQWQAICQSDPVAAYIENAATLGAIRADWRLFLAAIECDWSISL
jgi:hypothetical protein